MTIHANDQPRETHENYSGGKGRITFTTLLFDDALFKDEARFFKSHGVRANTSIGEHPHMLAHRPVHCGLRSRHRAG